MSRASGAVSLVHFERLQKVRFGIVGKVPHLYILEVLLDLIGVVSAVQYDLLHPRAGQELERILNQRGIRKRQ